MGVRTFVAESSATSAVFSQSTLRNGA
jgi:hypothetical protein